MSWFSDIFKQRAKDMIYSPLKSNQVPGLPDAQEELMPDGSYLTITLKSMRIVNVRVLTSKFYGVVHSFVSLNHVSGPATFQTVTTPAQLQKVDAKNVDKIIQANIPLVGPVPYRGEKVQLELGLFSVKEDDLAAPFVKLLETMSKTAGVSVLTAALPYVQPLKEGMEAIVGASDGNTLNIGISTTWNPPVTGWFMVMGAPKADIKIPSLEVTPDDFRLVDKDSDQPVEDYPYMVFTVTQSKKREDWFLLPYLKDTYQELQKSIKEGRRTDAEELIKVFKRVTLTSDDLLTEDAQRIVKLVEDKAKVVMSTTMVAAGDDNLPDLKDIPLYK